MLNSSKCKLMTFSRASLKVAPYRLGALESISLVDDLGVRLDPKLKFCNQILNGQ